MMSYKIHTIRLSNRESLYSELCFSLLQPSEQDLEAGADAGEEAADGKD